MTFLNNWSLIPTRSGAYKIQGEVEANGKIIVTSEVMTITAKRATTECGKVFYLRNIDPNSITANIISNAKWSGLSDYLERSARYYRKLRNNNR